MPYQILIIKSLKQPIFKEITWIIIIIIITLFTLEPSPLANILGIFPKTVYIFYIDSAIYL